MSVAHSVIAEPYIHEPKGVAAAAANKVYVSNGTGSGTWKKITSTEVDTTSVFNVNKFKLTAYLADIDNTAAVYVVLPVACTLTKVWTVLGGTIATADAVLTCKNHSGGAMATGVVTISFTGSAAKDVDSASPSTNNTFAAGEVLTIENNLGATNSVPVSITLELTQTA